MIRRKVCSLLMAMTATWFVAVPAQAGVIYTVQYDGSNLDLSGFLDLGATGIMSASAFDAALIDYSLTASVNGAASFTFTKANSTFGASGFGDAVEFDVTSASVSLLNTLNSSFFSSASLFLDADAVQPNGFIPNLRLTQTEVSFFNQLIGTDSVNGSFTLATAAVPEPTSLLLLGSGIAGIAVKVRKRRKTKVQ